jgi:hypothetical protein
MSPSARAAAHVRPAPFITSGQLCEATGLRQSRIRALVAEGLPAYGLDQRRFVFDRDEAVSWLTAHGYLVDVYRENIKNLVDAAPPLSAEQAAQIRAILGASVA